MCLQTSRGELGIHAGGWTFFLAQCYEIFLQYLLWCQKLPHNELPGENTKTQLSQDLQLDALMAGCEHVPPATRSDVSRVADTSKQSPRKKKHLNLGYAAIKQSKKIIIQKRIQC